MNNVSYLDSFKYNGFATLLWELGGGGRVGGGYNV